MKTNKLIYESPTVEYLSSMMISSILSASGSGTENPTEEDL